MPTFRYTIREHDPEKPWILVGEARHLTVELSSAGDFPVWAKERWPRSRFTAELDPGQEERHLRY